jgi:cell division protein FtsQ
VAQSRLSRPGWKILAGLVLTAVLAYGATTLARRLAFFRIRAVEVRGARNLRPADVVRALPVQAGASIFGNLDAVRAAAESIPGLDAAEVSRRLPGTVVVTVHEAEPVAYAMAGDQLRLVSTKGAILPFNPTVAAPDLPLVRDPDSLLAGLLTRIRATDPTLFSRITVAWRTEDAAIVAVDRRRYMFRPDAGAEAIQSVIYVEKDLERKNRPWTELDARFADQVVVRVEPG